MVQASASAPRRVLRRLRPRSMRGRVTLLVFLIAVVLLVPAAVAGSTVARLAITNGAWYYSREQAAVTAAAVRGGRLKDPIVPTVSGIDLVQVVGPDRRILASSAAAAGRGRLADARPGPGDPSQDMQVCPDSGDCLRLTALRVWPDATSPVVYAARLAPGLISTTILDGLFAAQALLLIALATWATWRITGRTLTPVDAIRVQLAAINVNDLSTRVPQSGGDDEITGLARTVNSTLERLERAKREQEETKAWLERTLELQRRFTTDASHELRTPLAGLRVQLEEAQLHPDDIDLPQMLKGALGDIDRLQAIISDLLLLARVEANTSATLKTVDLSELVARETTGRASDRHTVGLDLTPGVLVDVVPAQIERVLANLIDNAQRHACSSIQVQVRDAGPLAELTVTDDGAGIAEADRDVIFQRFTRLDAARSRTQGGTGLGLAIARDIAQAHGGSLTVEAPASQGARFVLQLPIARGVGEDREQVAPGGQSMCEVPRGYRPSRPESRRP